MREECPLGRVYRTVDEPCLGVAAEQIAGIGFDAGDNGGGERADTGNRRDPEHEAGEKDSQTPDTAAQLTTGEPQGLVSRECVQSVRRVAAIGDGAVHRSSMIFPSSKWICRSQRSATLGSCVIRSRVVPRRA